MTSAIAAADAAVGDAAVVGAIHRAEAWPLWQRVLFRFLFVYLLLAISPWTWLFYLPGTDTLARAENALMDAAVQWANRTLFHVRPVLIPPNGSGDTSWMWARLWFFLGVAALVCLVWSIVDRRAPAYPRLLYWLRTITRYYVAMFALSYGIIKLFLLQMSFPTQSLMATPLGDLLPMRLSWNFIGYSDRYQFFSGMAETMAGLLLLWRPTVTLGLMAAAGAFLNVVMINLSYDVPVKLFASHLLFAALFLLALDSRRLVSFLVLNQGAPATTAWEPTFTPRQRWFAWAGKALFVWFMLITPFWSGWQDYQQRRNAPAGRPFGVGLYSVTTYAVNGDTIPFTLADTLRWRDIAFDSPAGGSIGTTDTLFWQRYRRGYFRFKADTTKQLLTVWRSSWKFDSTFLFTGRLERADSTHFRLWTRIGNDSVYVELQRANRKYQLAERQFHWLSEYNR